MSDRHLCWVARGIRNLKSTGDRDDAQVNEGPSTTPKLSPFLNAVDSLLVYGKLQITPSKGLSPTTHTADFDSDESGSLVYPDFSRNRRNDNSKDDRQCTSMLLDEALFDVDNRTNDFSRSLDVDNGKGDSSRSLGSIDTTRAITAYSVSKGSLGTDSTVSESNEWLVEAILNERKVKGGGREFLVKWEGFDDPDDNTWEPYEHVMECEALDIWEAWKAQQGNKRIRKRRSSNK